MTPETAGRVTPWVNWIEKGEPWTVHFEDFAGFYDIYTESRGAIGRFRTFQDARLASEAINAFVALNPTDPLAAAQGLEELVKAARRVIKDHDRAKEEDDDPETLSDYGLRGALSRVTGKS